MASFDDKIKHSRRRKDHIAKDLRTPKYRERAVPPKLQEDEDERRFRRYHNFDWDEPYDPLMYDRDNEED